jgi:hypothetical protein
MQLNLRPHGLWFDDRPSYFTNSFSTLHSNENVCSQRDVPLSAFNFVTFSICKKSPPHIESIGSCPLLAIHRPDIPPLRTPSPTAFSQTMTILSAVLFHARPLIQGEPFPLMTWLMCTHPQPFYDSELHSTVNLTNSWWRGERTRENHNLRMS